MLLIAILNIALSPEIQNPRLKEEVLPNKIVFARSTFSPLL
jgi:hypothetical protein